MNSGVHPGPGTHPQHIFMLGNKLKKVFKKISGKKMACVFRQNFLPNPTPLRMCLLVSPIQNQCLSKTGSKKGHWESSEPEVATRAAREGWVSVAADGPREKPSSQDLCAQLLSFPCTPQFFTSVLCQLSNLPKDSLSAST